jgi:hypothetical protein
MSAQNLNSLSLILIGIPVLTKGRQNFMAMTSSSELLMKLALYTLLIVCSLGCDIAFAANNGESRTVAVSYVIRSLGSDIGTVSAKTVGTARDYDFLDDVKVNVRFLFFSFSLKSSETASIRGGKLVNYHKTIDTKGHRRELTGKLNGATFNIVVLDGGKTQHKEFPVTDYVTTNLEYPEVSLALGEVRRMRVLDLEYTEIVDREYRQITEEQAEINGRGSHVMTSDFADKNAEGRRWTAIVGELPVVWRQEGKEKTGLFNPSYSVRQTKVTVDP